MTPSRFQAGIFDWIDHNVGHAIVEAKAGSGKTTTALMSLDRIAPHKRVGFVAFNKSIADELKSKVPTYCQAMTLNGLGYGAWIRRAGKPNLVKNKTTDLMHEMFTPAEIFKAGGGTIRKLVGLAKAYGIAPEGIGAVGLMPDNEESWQALVTRFDIELESPTTTAYESMQSGVLAKARLVLEASAKQTDVIDFDDQLYLTVIYNCRVPGYDWLFVDEAQDLSPIQHALVERAIINGGRIVGIGDKNQSIYSFRGADSDSMSNLRSRLNATVLPLSISYRCPKSHIRLAQTFVPEIEAAPDADEGYIARLGTKWDYRIFKADDLVICRANAPLVRLAYRLLRDRVAVRILGRDLGEGLVHLIERLNCADLYDLQEALAAWHIGAVQRLRQRDPEASTDAVDDKRDCIEAFILLFPRATPASLCVEIRSIFDDDETNRRQRLTLATIHKSKGLEADRVWILNNSISERLVKKKSGWQQQQELNLLYVSVTRSKYMLGFIELEKKN